MWRFIPVLIAGFALPASAQETVTNAQLMRELQTLKSAISGIGLLVDNNTAKIDELRIRVDDLEKLQMDDTPGAAVQKSRSTPSPSSLWRSPSVANNGSNSQRTVTTAAPIEYIVLPQQVSRPVVRFSAPAFASNVQRSFSQPFANAGGVYGGGLVQSQLINGARGGGALPFLSGGI